MFLSSVLERRTSLEPAVSMLSPRTNTNSHLKRLSTDANCHLKRLSIVNKENCGPGLYASNKENCQPSDKQVTCTPAKKTIALGALEGLRKQLAQEEMLRAHAEEALAEQHRRMLQERSSTAMELEKQKAYSRKLEQVLRGSEMVERHADLDVMQKRLHNLKRWTAKNEACLQQLNSKHAHATGNACSKQSAYLEHRMLVSKVVHNALVHALLTDNEGPEAVGMAQASQTNLVQLEEHTFTEANADAEAGGKTTQQDETDHRDEQLAELQSEAAKLAVKCAELESSLQEQQASAHKECKRWQQRVQDLEHQLEKFDRTNDRREDSVDLDKNNAILAQNRQLLLTVSALKQECETIQAEKQCLQETVADLERSLDAVSGQHAELAGHVNHRQKIRHTMQIKEERDKLREKHVKLQQRISVLEASQSSQALMSALGRHDPSTPSCRGPEIPKLNSSTPKNAKLPGSRRSLLPCDGPAPAAERRCQQLEQDLDHVSINLKHVTTLLERAFSKTGVSLTARSGSKDISHLLEQLCRFPDLKNSTSQ